MTVDAPSALAPLVSAFRQAADNFSAFVRDATADEPETAAMAARFSEMAEDVAFALTAEAPVELVRLLIARPHPDLCTAAGSFRAYKKKGKWGEAAKRVGLSKADGDRLNAAAETVSYTHLSSVVSTFNCSSQIS